MDFRAGMDGLGLFHNILDVGLDCDLGNFFFFCLWCGEHIILLEKAASAGECHWGPALQRCSSRLK